MYDSWDLVPSNEVNATKIRFSENFAASLITKEAEEGEYVTPEMVVKSLIGIFLRLILRQI
jgi:hypothetical protein